MADDELEYHVTFPTKFSRSRRPRGAEAAAGAAAAPDDVELSESQGKLEAEPVIFLLGWYCAEEKELAKYCAIYHSEGYITIRYILPPECLFGRRLGDVRGIAAKVLEAFFDLGLEENPIFFHLFSNGGGNIYRSISDIINGRNPREFAALKIAGVVWDSAPCRPTFMAGLRAYSLFTPIYQQQPWYMAYLKAAPACLWMAIKHIVLPSHWEANRLMNSFIQAVIDDKMSCPQLFLYSKADCIAWYRDIQDVVQKRREQGVEVLEAFWEDSDHLEHFAKHNEEYVDACLDLILQGIDYLGNDDDDDTCR